MRRKEVAEESGGGWKGAFADFCMSMMTLFMVLWIVSVANQEQREKLSLYFSDPGIFDSVNSRYMMEDTSNGLVVNHDTGGRAVMDRPDPEARTVRGGDPLEMQITSMSKYHDNMNLQRIPGGLLIELVETDSKPMFRMGDYQLTAYFEDMLLELGPLLVQSGYDMAIIGHTDSTPYSGSTPHRGGGSFDNWTLSYARANSVRGIMEFVHMPTRQIVQVSGMADSRPLDMKHPRSPVNRRVELILMDPERGEEIRDVDLRQSRNLNRTLQNVQRAANNNQI